MEIKGKIIMAFPMQEGKRHRTQLTLISFKRIHHHI